MWSNLNTLSIAIIAVVLIILTWIIINLITNNRDTVKNEKLYKTAIKQKGLNSDYISFTPHNKSQNCLSIDVKKKKLSFGFINNIQFGTKEFDFDSVLELNVLIDNKPIGILSREKGNKEEIVTKIDELKDGRFTMKINKVKEIGLKLLLQNNRFPVIMFPLLPPMPDGWNTNSNAAQKAFKTTLNWLNYFDMIFLVKNTTTDENKE